jgi:hypothetical protein
VAKASTHGMSSMMYFTLGLPLKVAPACCRQLQFGGGH